MPDEVNPNPEDEIARQEEERRKQEEAAADRRKAVKYGVVESRNKIIETRKKVAALTFDIARHVETVASGLLELRQEGGLDQPNAGLEDSLKTDPIDFLFSECKLPHEEAATFLELSKCLSPALIERLSTKPISPAVLMALTEIGAAARRTSIARINSGMVLGAEEILEIGRATERERRDRRELLIEDRKLQLQAKAVATVVPSMASLDSGIKELLWMLHDFYRVHTHDMDDIDLEPHEIDIMSASQAGAYNAIRRHAASLLPILEGLFGSEPLPRSLWPGMHGPRDRHVQWRGRGHDVGHFEFPDDTDIALVKAHLSLTRLASGEFGHRGGFSFVPNMDYPWGFDVLDALEFLSPEPEWYPAPSNDPIVTVPHMLKSIQFGEMTAGMAVGLYDGGFDARRIFESSEISRETIRKNWPRWGLSATDVRQVQFEPGETDLLAGGLPSQPYRRRAGENAGDCHEDLLASTVKMVERMQPRAFFFHVLQDVLFPTHVDFRDAVMRAFGKAGYEVAINTLDGSDFTETHGGKRIVLIGMRPADMLRFRMPVLKPEKSVGQVIGDLLMVNRSRGFIGYVKKDKFRNLRPEEKFEVWAERWMDKFGGDNGPKASFARDMFLTQSTKSWERLGLRGPRWPANNPPTFGDIMKWEEKFVATENQPEIMREMIVGEKGYFPVPTLDMLRRFYDFPSEWRFVGSAREQFDQIVGSFAPELAKMIGLAIYAAIENVRFNMCAMHDSHRLPRHHIGEEIPRFTDRNGRIHTISGIKLNQGSKFFLDPALRPKDEEHSLETSTVSVRDRHPDNPYYVQGREEYYEAMRRRATLSDAARGIENYLRGESELPQALTSSASSSRVSKESNVPIFSPSTSTHDL